jgi:hypothetical protein
MTLKLESNCVAVESRRWVESNLYRVNTYLCRERTEESRIRPATHAKELIQSTSNQKQTQKTYNSADSHLVTHDTTNTSARRLNRAERTGSIVVSYSTTTKTPKLPVCGIAQTEHGFHLKGLTPGLRRLVVCPLLDHALGAWSGPINISR